MNDQIDTTDEGPERYADARALEVQERKFLQSAKSTLKQTNWLSAFFNPFGQIPTVVFTRGQIYLWIARIAILVVGIILSASGSRNAAGLFIVAGFALTAIISLILHMQRLEDAGRPVWLAGFSILPLVGAVLFGFMALQGINAQMQKARQAAIEAASTPKPAVAEGAGEVAEGDAAKTAESGDSKPAAEGSERSNAQRGQGNRRGDGRRGGRGGGQPPLPFYVMAGLPVWLGLGLLVTFFTWLYVAPAQRRETGA